MRVMYTRIDQFCLVWSGTLESQVSEYYWSHQDATYIKPFGTNIVLYFADQVSGVSHIQFDSIFVHALIIRLKVTHLSDNVRTVDRLFQSPIQPCGNTRNEFRYFLLLTLFLPSRLRWIIETSINGVFTIVMTLKK